MSLKRYAIIVAGGAGMRMNQDTPKQFLLLGGKPVLLHSLERFYRAEAEVILVLPENEIQRWQSLVDAFQITIPHQIAIGGSTRNRSVYNGLAKISNPKSVVAVHDAARPLVTIQLIQSLFETAEHRGNAIPVIPVKDSLRKINNRENQALNRSEIFAVQTPQVFDTSLLMEAFAANHDPDFTDEASLLESCGKPINTISGENHNIKITYENDLLIAETLLNKQLFC
jgi:2-C-methyl-D-erythritol 4-phosphate cytidylyltransferase